MKFIFKKFIVYFDLYNFLKKINLVLTSNKRHQNYFLDSKKCFLVFNSNKFFFDKLTYFLENFNFETNITKKKHTYLKDFYSKKKFLKLKNSIFIDTNKN